MRYLILILCLNITLNLLSQKISVFADSAILIKNGEIIHNGTKIEKGEKGILIAFRKGKKTYGDLIENILSKQYPNNEFKINLEPISYTRTSKPLKDLENKEITDNNKKLRNYVYGFNISLHNFNKLLSDSIYKSHPQSDLVNAGFYDLSLSGNIVSCNVKTKGIPGFRISVLVKWVLIDEDSNDIVFESIKAGYCNSLDEISTNKGYLSAAIKNSYESFLTDSVFYSKLVMEQDRILNRKVIISFIKQEEHKNISDFYKKASKSVVAIKSDNGYSTGFVLSDKGYILTDYNNIRKSSIDVILDSNIVIKADLISKDKINNIALLKISENKLQALSIDTTFTNNEIGDNVYSILTRIDIDYKKSISKGSITFIKEDVNNFIISDVKINGENMGAPILNKKGEVIGLIISKISDDEIKRTVTAISIKDVLRLLNIFF